MRLSKSEQDALVAGHLPIAQAVAHRFRGLGVDEDDLTQEIMISLCESARSFDQSKHPGVPFFAYARQGAIGRCADLISAVDGLKAPARLAKARARVQAAIDELYREGAEHPTVEQVQAKTRLEVPDIELCLALPKIEQAELNSIPDAPLRRHQEERAINELWSALDILDPKDRALITGRYGLGDGDEPVELDLYRLSVQKGIPVTTLKRRLDAIHRRLRTELLRRGFHRSRSAPDEPVLAQANAS